MLVVTTATIVTEKIKIKFVRSTGPGGQNVNKCE